MYGVTEIPLMNVLLPTAVTAIRGLVLTVSENVEVLTCRAVSRTVTANVVAVTRYWDGVPVICPELPAKFNPVVRFGVIV